MLKTNAELRTEALNKLRGNWKKPVIASLIYCAVSCSISLIPGIGSIINLLIALPIAWGLYAAILEFYRDGKEIVYEDLFSAFNTSKEYQRITFTMLLSTLYTLLWMLLLIIPGIIKSLSYSMVYFILKDDPDIKYNAAIEKSMAMMEGHKMKLFLMALNFMLWSIIGSITIIGILWVIPYTIAALAAFYEDVKADYLAKQQ